MNNMLNKLYDSIEQVLESIDVGGEQSRQFIGEIELLKEVLGYPEPVTDEWDELQQRQIIAQKLGRLAIEAEGVLIHLPKNPVSKWFDGTYQDSTIEMDFEELDLSKLLKFIEEVGVNPDT
jgi:hypothetical protein